MSVNNCHERNIVNIDCTVRASQLDQYSSRNRLNGIRREITYSNRTHTSITLVDRNGIRYHIPRLNPTDSSVPTYHHNSFIIHESIEIDCQRYGEIATYLEALDVEKISKPLKVFREEFFKKVQTVGVTGHIPRVVTIRMDYIIPREDIQSHRTVYLSMMDLLISINPLVETTRHPYEIQSLTSYGLNDIVDKWQQDIQLDSGMLYHIDIVDNEKRVGQRFFPIGDSIHRIDSVTSMTRSSGVYFTAVNPSAPLEIQIDQKKLTYEEAEAQLGLGRTEEEARYQGNIKLRREAELAELNRKIHELTLESKQKDKQHREEIQELELEKARFKAEIENKKLERKDYYEERSHARKDTSEVIKFIPGLILGIIAIVIAARK